MTNYRGLLKVDNKNNYLNTNLHAKPVAAPFVAKAVDLKKITAKWMLVGLLATGSILMATKLLAADENLYAKNYKAQNNGGLVSLEATPDTKMYVSNHKEDDDVTMLESGYDLMGSTGFSAGDVPADLALQHAKTLKADTVLVYSKYGSAKMAINKIQMVKDAAKQGKELTEKELADAEETTYKYYASYWAKLPAPLLGVHVIKLVKSSNDVDNEGNPTKGTPVDGLKIIAVIKDSPAAKAGLVRGDMLYKIADTTLAKPEELSNLVRKSQGQEVAIEYERGGARKLAKATINTRK